MHIQIQIGLQIHIQIQIVFAYQRGNTLPKASLVPRSTLSLTLSPSLVNIFTFWFQLQLLFTLLGDLSYRPGLTLPRKMGILIQPKDL